MIEIEKQRASDFDKALAENDFNLDARGALTTADFESMDDETLELLFESYKDFKPYDNQVVKDLLGKSQEFNEIVLAFRNTRPFSDLLQDLKSVHKYIPKREIRDMWMKRAQNEFRLSPELLAQILASADQPLPREVAEQFLEEFHKTEHLSRNYSKKSAEQEKVGIDH